MTQGAAAARRLTIMVVVALGAAGLAGCGKDAPPPAPTPSSSSTPAPTSAAPTPTPTPSPTPPAKPTEWTQNDDAGALAAAQYFMDLFVYANKTGDLVAWDEISGPECSFCINTHDDVTAVYGGGGRIEGSEVTLADAHVVGTSEALGVWAVEYTYSTTAGRAVDVAGETIATYPEERGYLLLNVAWNGTGWLFVDADGRDEPSGA